MNSKKENEKNRTLRAIRSHILKAFKLFSANTSIHGFRFLGDQYRMYGERAFWGLAICFQILFCAISVNFVVKKWAEDPVIISYGTKGAPLIEVEFKKKNN